MQNTDPRHSSLEFSASSGEHSADPEAFISSKGAELLVAFAMKERVDPGTSQLLPIKEELALMNGPGYSIKPLEPRVRYDVVLPEPTRYEKYDDGGTLRISQDYDVDGELYDALTDKHEVTLDAAGIEQLSYVRAKLEETLASHPSFEWVLDRWQKEDAYHISRKETPPPNSDGKLISPLRVYVPGGVQGVRIMNHVIETGTDFAHAKVWTPQAARGRQTFRQDTPILFVNTVEQLRSVVTAVRAIATQGLIEPKDNSPIGIPIEGAPGAFIGQPKEDQSFNGQMARLWSEPIRLACNSDSMRLHAGEVVTWDWVEKAAKMATAIAQQQAQAAGINPNCHALLPGQHVDVILDAIKA